MEWQCLNGAMPAKLHDRPEETNLLMLLGQIHLQRFYIIILPRKIANNGSNRHL